MSLRGEVLRTPEERFAGLPGFDFTSRHLTIPGPSGGTLRMCYVDEGPREARTALMLHGEPTWSFLYRHMIPPVLSAGFRVVAPDWIGFGRSDKLAHPDDYSYGMHVESLRALVAALDLRRLTLVCQDWGGPIGLRVLAEMPDRFDAVLATNTLLPTCELPPRGVPDWPGTIIEQWVALASSATDLSVEEVIAGVCVERPAAEVLRGYAAPFPDARYKAGVLAFPRLIPIRADMPGVAENRRAWEVLERFEKPFLTAFSDRDPSTKAWEQVFRGRVPGARGQPRVEIRGAGHFVQEEQGGAVAGALLALMGRLPR